LKINVFLLVPCFIILYNTKKVTNWIYLKICYNWYLFLFTPPRSYLHHTYKNIASLLLNQICGSIKPTKPCVVTRGLKFCNIYDVGNYACGAINNLIKHSELKDLLKSCGADDVYCCACGALNDSNKTCGALRFNKSLRS